MKKKVCIVVYDISDLGGTNQVASALSFALSEYYELTILSIRKNRNEIPHAFAPGAEITVLLDSTVSVADTTKRCFGPAKEYFKTNKTEVALLIGHYPGFIISVLRPFVKTKLIFCDHGALVNQWDDKKERLMRRIGTALCDKVVTLTERSRDDYIKLFYTKKSKISCIYNWIDTGGIKKTCYSAEHKKVMWAGRFSPEKGNDMMYEVAKKVLPENPEWQWDVFGDGDGLEQYREKCREDGLENQLHFCGRTMKLSEQYSAHSIFTLTSYREGLPLVLLEAKAYGLPIVAFDVVTGPAEIVCDTVDGYLIKPLDTDAMAEKLDYLMKNPAELERLSLNSGANLGKFSKETILVKWRVLIDGI